VCVCVYVCMWCFCMCGVCMYVCGVCVCVWVVCVCDHKTLPLCSVLGHFNEVHAVLDPFCDCRLIHACV